MITDIQGNNVKEKLNRDTLKPYWMGYFEYQKNAPDLHHLINEEFKLAVENIKSETRPFVDSQQVIGKILTGLGNKHSFHRQFRELLPDLHANQVLGMHLYDFMLQDQIVWVYTETKPNGHLFSHATYFQSK